MSGDVHETFRSVMDRILTGEASVAEESALQDHLRGCAVCREYQNLSMRVIAAVGGFAFDAEPGSNERVQAAITEHVRELGTVRPSGGKWAWSVAASFAFTVAGSIFAWKVAGFVGPRFSIAPQHWQTAVIVAWIVPSVVASVLFASLRAFSLAQSGEEGRTA